MTEKGTHSPMNHVEKEIESLIKADPRIDFHFFEFDSNGRSIVIIYTHRSVFGSVKNLTYHSEDLCGEKAYTMPSTLEAVQQFLTEIGLRFCYCRKCRAYIVDMVFDPLLTDRGKQFYTLYAQEMPSKL